METSEWQEMQQTDCRSFQLYKSLQKKKENRVWTAASVMRALQATARAQISKLNYSFDEMGLKIAKRAAQ